METLNFISFTNIITPGETICYALLITLFALLGLNESCLVNTFSFACYWGFKAMLQTTASSTAVTESSIVVYLISGLVLFVFVNLYYLQRDLRHSRHADDIAAGH